jgi:hypothetical protein
LTQLQGIILWGTNVTEAGKNDLQKALPKAQINGVPLGAGGGHSIQRIGAPTLHPCS